jgi:hypothetical protein
VESFLLFRLFVFLEALTCACIIFIICHSTLIGKKKILPFVTNYYCRSTHNPNWSCHTNLGIALIIIVEI